MLVILIPVNNIDFYVLHDHSGLCIADWGQDVNIYGKRKVVNKLYPEHCV